MTTRPKQCRTHQQQLRARRAQPASRRGQEERLGPVQRHGGHRGVPEDKVRHLVGLRVFFFLQMFHLHLHFLCVYFFYGGGEGACGFNKINFDDL